MSVQGVQLWRKFPASDPRTGGVAKYLKVAAAWRKEGGVWKRRPLFHRDDTRGGWERVTGFPPSPAQNLGLLAVTRIDPGGPTGYDPGYYRFDAQFDFDPRDAGAVALIRWRVSHTDGTSGFVTEQEVTETLDSSGTCLLDFVRFMNTDEEVWVRAQVALQANGATTSYVDSFNGLHLKNGPA